MGKLLFWVVVIALVWLAWSFVRVSQRKQEQDARADRENGSSHRSGRSGSAKAGPEALEQMVACDRCGVFLPASDAVLGRNGRYCCIEHRNDERR